MQAFGQHAADDDSEREEVLEGLNFFDEQDEDDVDDEPGHRVVEPIEDFDLVEDEDEDGRLGTSRPEPALAPDALSHALFHHHGMRANALHMKTVWRDVVTEGDSPAISAPLADKSTIICRTGMLMLASGTGAWRVRDTMDRVASVLGVTIHVDLSLLSFECTCIEGHHIFNEVVSLPTTGVNTHRIWMMENFLREIETYGRNFTVHEYHEMLATVEGTRPDYRPVQQGLAAGAACGAFVFLLGGGPIEMLGAFVGAGIGNFVRSTMLSRRIGQFSALAMGVAVACVCYLLALLGLSRFDPMALAHEEGYIGAMLFVIPGFPLITAGLDISKLDMRSGIERLTYAVSIVVVATLVGWVVAECVGLSPDDFAPQGLGALQLTALRAFMSLRWRIWLLDHVQQSREDGCGGGLHWRGLEHAEALARRSQRSDSGAWAGWWRPSRGGCAHRSACLGAARECGRAQAHVSEDCPNGSVNCHHGSGTVPLPCHVLHVCLRYGQHVELVRSRRAHRCVSPGGPRCRSNAHGPSLEAYVVSWSESDEVSPTSREGIS